MEPIKTEYKGIVFDSKSEAVFARALDLAGNEWFYHPGSHCGHDWDFLVFSRQMEYAREWSSCCGKTFHSESSFCNGPVVKPSLVELKPSMPTRTYVDNLTQKMRDCPYESLVVYGSPWSGITNYKNLIYSVYPIFSTYYKYGWGDYEPCASNGFPDPYAIEYCAFLMYGLSNDVVLEASKYRFDLAVQHAAH